jgi:hypothetical protein
MKRSIGSEYILVLVSNKLFHIGFAAFQLTNGEVFIG